MMRKTNANDASVHAGASDLHGNLVTVDDQVLTLLDQLVAVKLLVAWEAELEAPAYVTTHYTIGKRMREIATKISSAATTHPTA